jgi:ketosteroid isomerase-like protein
VGQYELSGAEGKRMDQGKYIVIWKKQVGQWKLYKDIWNTSISS